MSASGSKGALLAAAALMVNAFVWGVSWWPFRQLESHGVHPLWATAIIYVVSLGCLLAVRPRAWRGLLQYPLLGLLMVASGLTNVGFNWAVTVGDVVRVVLLFYLMPLWAVLLAWLLLGEKPTAISLSRMLLALVGVVIVLKTGDSAWPVPESAADWLALMGGFSFALTNILLRKLRHTPAESRVLAMFGGGALMATSAACLGLARGVVALPPAPALSWLVYAVALSLAFLIGNLALQYGAARLSSHGTALIMLSEVVFASASSVALGAAELTGRTLAGGGLILLAALWSALACDKPAPSVRRRAG
ncbi:DMT family transporter [Rhodoferax sediminis]|uniref:DMT family transporter n=1 Tax=Rhodoferax sediminis TaxID=2509614 RepID=A0A515DGC5_9BURK|nr:DMT family transporter [Rhodoferax sediminis]QDL39448.1 DMT family transporter [Rhodoferax sediminis]